MYDQYREKIFNFYKSRKRMPSYSEIMALLGFKSKNAVFKLVSKLIDEGVISKDKDGKIIPGSNGLFGSVGEIPVLGLVEAGIPTEASEIALDTINFDEYLVGDSSRSYALEVKGDSMIEEGIKEGDLVIVDTKVQPKDGDIVIAEVDGGWTMKFLRQKPGKKVFLEPANKKYKPIYPENDMRIGAVVKGVIRKY